MRMLVTLAVSTLTTSALAAPAAPKWAVLPARSDAPPPRDPTLMRLSQDFATALEAALGHHVALVSQDLRDDACPSFDGDCPRDASKLLAVDRVVTLKLEADHSALVLRVYGEGLERTERLPCRWEEGFVHCDHSTLAKAFAKSPEAP